MALVPSSSRGGAAGFVIGSSYLRGNVSSHGATAAGTLTNLTFTQAALVGADLSRNADGFTVDVATAGWYQAVVTVSMGGAMDAFLVSLDTTADPAADVYIPGTVAAGGVDIQLVTPVMFVGAGGFIRFSAVGQAAAGNYTISAFSGGLQVVRFA